MADLTPGPAPVRPARRPDVPLLVFVGVVVLAVVGSLVSLSSHARGGTQQQQDRGPASSVRGFFDAIVAADASRALSYAVAPPVDQPMLTDEVLAANQRLAPMHDVVVTETPGSTGAVEVRWSAGDHAVSDHFRTTEVNGEYKLEEVTNTVTFVTANIDKLPILANGIAVEESPVELFPGFYTFSTGLASVDWGDDDETAITVGLAPVAPKLVPRVTAAGRKAFLAGAKKIVGTCTAKHDLDPGGCPFGFGQPTRGPRIPDSTVRWQVKGNPWKAVGDPEISSFVDPGVAKAHTEMTFTCRCSFSTGERCKPQDVRNRVTFAADVRKDPLEVVFTTF